MANQQHIEWLLDGVEAWNAQRERDVFTPNFSNANLYKTFKQAGKLDEQGCIPLVEANLSNAVLTGANFHKAKLLLANLTNAQLVRTDLTEADLTVANLTDALLTGANLSGADLLQTNVTGAQFIDVQLEHAMLIYTDIWKAHFNRTEVWRATLYERTQSPGDGLVEDPVISSTGILLDKIDAIRRRHDASTRYYFRGEFKDVWDLRPSLLRTNVPPSLANHEGHMLSELVSRRPEEFGSANSALSQWVLAQHHGLKTRFLDVMKNPLVGLYFACEDKGGDESSFDGCFHVFATPQSLVKPYNSDTVSVLANFARLSKEDQKSLLGTGNPFRGHDYREAMGRLCQLIQSEKPYFAERIHPRDFFRVLIIEPQQTIERIRAQTGAFLSSVFHQRFEPDEILKWNPRIPIYTHYRFRVPRECKPRIRRELGLLNITRETLLPGLDTAAEAVTETYRDQ